MKGEKVGLVQSVIAKNPIFLKHKRQLLELNIEDKIIKSSNYPVIKGSASLGTTYFNAFKASNTNPIFAQTKDNFAQQVAVAVTIPNTKEKLGGYYNKTPYVKLRYIC
ncbi:hypothetical protein ACS126_16515 [Sphingobacterium lactis]|uniref:hypothetical protein n=1 Tax=Sphingobacterium lactis TaxID=797291 RepID=UPI003EC88664